MRSAGTDSHRMPHTGITEFEDGLAPIPSAALSAPDADQLARLLALGRRAYASRSTAAGTGQRHPPTSSVKSPGANEAEGSRADRRPSGFVGSGTGAIDDAAGIGITMAAAKLIGDLPKRPARTIRVVAFANEEQGLHGGIVCRAHKDEVARHAIAAESDFGAGRIYGFDAHVSPDAQPAMQQIVKALAPLGIESAARKGRSGIRHRTGDGKRRRVGMARPRRQRLLRPAPHRRRHAGQDRSEGARAERRGLRRVRLSRGAGRWRFRKRPQAGPDPAK